ncbi:hypothetical protein UA08_00764 [Talaromyces atroroseus]|uniref:HTH La-type RNA-binding domain-containing protein n=1 Tax=Talaromyces atroroseus TaxID=1441469 RepID=A0A225BBU6_TALAT|nr:hypothetical protein UA08_00764 [Talaromyces atroroseus]OKL64375.1 hypothetical protein UA08_00764 [Talaromyces atroroseus]
MSGEVKATEAPQNANADAEKDVKDLLAELKGGEENKTENGAAAATSAQEDDAAKEARIVAEAAKLGEESAVKESKPEQKTERSERPFKSRNYRDNIKSDFTSQKTTDDPSEIRKQVEFYFSDSNLPMDNFLLKKVGGSANHAVDLSLLHSFKRMRRFQPFSAIVEALKSSETLELVENDTQIRRKVPLPESVNDFLDPNVVKVFENEAMARSVYVKGFGEEGPTTQFDIEAFFAPHGPTNAIRLRRAYDKKFKGSVFVEFDSEETQKKFLALDPKPKWKGQDLIIKSKKDYCDEKVRDIESGKIKASGRGNNSGRGRGGRGRGRSDRGRSDRGRNDRDDRRDWRERRKEDQKKGFREDKPTIDKDARGVPVIKSTVDATPSASGQKRAREEDSNGAHAAKKVDVKEG